MLTTIHPIIKLTHIDKYIESPFQRIFILKGVDLRIKQGEFVTVMEPSGVGKSALLNIIGWLDQDYEGTYEFDGASIQAMKEKQRAALQEA